MVIFSGCLKDSKKSYKGTFDIPNLSEENEAHEIDVSCHVAKCFVYYYISIVFDS